MALLRNFSGIFLTRMDPDFCREYLDKLKRGVVDGKQFPFRYYSAWRAVKEKCFRADISQMILKALEECVDLSVQNLPRLRGRTMCLSDNSGSAWGGFTSEYGSVTVAVIDNLSSAITAARSDEGDVGKFGSLLRVFPVREDDHMLELCNVISKDKYNDVGGQTEGGIWEFFYQIIWKKEHWDNIFIYPDQQAGHGCLYGTDDQIALYQRLGYGCGQNDGYLDVYALVELYRKTVNLRVNVFSVQTAGYTNAVMPEYAYRTCILWARS